MSEHEKPFRFLRIQLNISTNEDGTHTATGEAIIDKDIAGPRKLNPELHVVRRESTEEPNPVEPQE